MTDTNTVTVNGCLVTWAENGQPREAMAMTAKAAKRVARRITKRLVASR